MAFVPRVVDAVSPVPTVAAGGIADGRGLAAVLALGASGAWMGTRFLLSEEALAHPRYRDRLIAAVETDAVYTTLFDGGWRDSPLRALRNATYAGWEDAGRPPPGRRPGEGEIIARAEDGSDVVRYASAAPLEGATGDIEAMVMYAGQGVGLVRRLQPATEIVREVAAEAARALDEARGSVRAVKMSADTAHR